MPCCSCKGLAYTQYMAVPRSHLTINVLCLYWHNRWFHSPQVFRFTVQVFPYGDQRDALALLYAVSCWAAAWWCDTGILLGPYPSQLLFGRGRTLCFVPFSCFVFFFFLFFWVSQLVIFFLHCVTLTWQISQLFIVSMDMCWCCFSQEVMSPWTLPPTLPSTLPRARCMATIKCHCQEDLWNKISFRGGRIHSDITIDACCGSWNVFYKDSHLSHCSVIPN